MISTARSTPASGTGSDSLSDFSNTARLVITALRSTTFALRMLRSRCALDAALLDLFTDRGFDSELMLTLIRKQTCDAMVKCSWFQVLT
jgi:hypothetical protein